MVSKFNSPLPTVDIIVYDSKHKRIVLVERKYEPSGWALPGGFVDYGETLEMAAIRECWEETSLNVELLCQFQTYSNPARDTRKHTISTVFVAQTIDGVLNARDDAVNAEWHGLFKLPQLVFDHTQILTDFVDNYVTNQRFFLQSNNLKNLV